MYVLNADRKTSHAAIPAEVNLDTETVGDMAGAINDILMLIYSKV